jgi:hypothetical protein
MAAMVLVRHVAGREPEKSRSTSRTVGMSVCEPFAAGLASRRHV